MRIHIHIIGAGGIASYLLPPLYRSLLSPEQPYYWHIHLHDGDTLTDVNLNRQLFTQDAIGHNKAEALLQSITMERQEARLTAHPDYIDNASSLTELVKASLEPGDKVIYISCADNNHARREVVEAVTSTRGSIGFIGANETHSAEAFVVLDNYANPDNHPFHRHPEMEVEDGQSPVQAIGCTGDAALIDKPQLPVANFKAACAILQLINAWVFQQPNYNWSTERLTHEQIINNMPFYLRANGYHNSEETYGQYINSAE